MLLDWLISLVMFLVICSIIDRICEYRRRKKAKKAGDDNG